PAGRRPHPRRARGAAELDRRGCAARRWGTVGRARAAVDPRRGGPGVQHPGRRWSAARRRRGVRRRLPDDAAHRASARGSPGAAMTGSVPGALLGAVAGLGLVLVLNHVRARRVRLDERLAPYLRPARTTSQLLVEGATQTPPATLVLLSRPVGLASLVVIVVAAAVAGVVLPDYLLQRQVNAREARILAELPTVAELLALAVGAGEGAVGALERVARSTHGELSGELARTLADARSGTPLTGALENLADRVRLAPLTRFAQG